MKVQDKKWIRFRIYLVACFFIIGLGVILARAYQLQVLDKDKLGALALAGYKGEIKLPTKRGTIYDREGHELAASVEVGSIFAHPNLVEEKVKTANRLARKLKMSRKDILPLLRSDRSFVWIKRKISPDKIREVKELDLKGVGFATETRRYYPGRDIAAHLLGFTGTDNKGLEGLEKKYDDILRGPENTLVQMRDALRRPFYISKPSSDARPIHNLILTIDKDIQYKAQQALDAAVKKARGKSGQCVILDPETGEVMAMAVVPSFNPNVFEKYHPYEWRNRTVTDCYEPGSAIKVFLLATALEESVVSPRTLFNCENGRYKVADRFIHDTKKHGILTVSGIIRLSSNIGAVKIGAELGYERFYGYLEKFGFGKRTGIGLVGERSGFVRSFESSKEVDRANTYFGQGMTATSIQLATAMAAVANGGKLMRPYVVKAITDHSGNIIKENHPQVVRRVISRDTAEMVSKILEGVVSEKGTAPQAAIEGFRVAGKTGTSQKVDPVTRRYSKENYVSTFIGFAPANSPKLVILIMVDEPREQVYGGVVAGPAFKDVGAWALNNLQINPQIRLANIENELPKIIKKSSKSESMPKERIVDKEILPDFTGRSMREVLREITQLGLKIEVEGTGLAFKQNPAPGSSLKKISSIKVSFRPPV